MPALHPFAGGFDGVNHGEHFRIADPDMAYLVPAKTMAMTVVDLLAGGAALARRALEALRPPMTRARYLHYLRTGQAQGA